MPPRPKIDLACTHVNVDLLAFARNSLHVPLDYRPGRARYLCFGDREDHWTILPAEILHILHNHLSVLSPVHM